MSRGGGRLPAVDALRFVAAFLVVLNHTTLPHDLPAWAAPVRWLSTFGGAGVTLFLVLSGFSITLRWEQRPGGGFPVVAFWKRRFFRLYPTFWAAALVSFGLLVVAHGWSAVAHQGRPWLWFGGQVPVVVQVLGYLTVVTANIVPLAHMGRAWSLALEEHLYALYTVIQVRWGSTVRPVRLLGWAVALELLWPLLLAAVHPGWGAPTHGALDNRELFMLFQVPVFAAPWVAGWVAAQARAGHVALPRQLRSLRLGAALLALAVLLRTWGGPVLRLPAGRVVAPVDVLLTPLSALAFFIVVSAVVVPTVRRVPARPLVRRAVLVLASAGLWSYSLYLLHPPALAIVEAHTRLPLAATLVLEWAFALVVAWVFFLLVERRWVARAQAVPVHPSPVTA